MPKKLLQKHNIWAILCILIILSGCRHAPVSDELVDYSDKFWAHQANDTSVAQDKASRFKGLEVDMNYSAYQNQLFIGHNLRDTINHVSFAQWLKAIANCNRLHFWFDIKNLSEENARQICDIILNETEKYGITQQILVENSNYKALKIVKKYHIPVLLWVDNIFWWDNKDTASWYQTTQQHISALKPAGISGEYTLHPLLTESFPKEKIYYWHTPCEATPENLAFDRHLAQIKSVKVILVDYNEPVAFNY